MKKINELKQQLAINEVDRELTGAKHSLLDMSN